MEKDWKNREPQKKEEEEETVRVWLRTKNMVSDFVLYPRLECATSLLWSGSFQMASRQKFLSFSFFFIMKKYFDQGVSDCVDLAFLKKYDKAPIQLNLNRVMLQT